MPRRPDSPRSAPGRWRVLRDPPASGPWNMAVDEALSRCLAEDEGVLRIYRWSRPTLSLGRNQPGRSRYDEAAMEELGVQVVRRPTGGREVLHDRELTYAVIVPVGTLGSLRESYRVVNGALVEALRSMEVPAEVAIGRRPTPPLDAGACFRTPVEGEVAVAGRKLVGSAQARFGRILLQHGSLLLAPPSVRLETLHAPAESGVTAGAMGSRTRGHLRTARDGLPPVSEESITLSEILGDPIGFQRVAAVIEAGVAGALGGQWSRSQLTEREREAARSLLPRYESPGWTWRR